MRHFINKTGDQDGSVMVIALMVLAIMTVIALMSADTTVTENFILRNAAIYKQNVNLVEAAVMEGLQEVMQLNVPTETDIQLMENMAGAGSGDDVSLWLNSDNGHWASNNLDDQWYSATSGRVLDPSDTDLNLRVPDLADAGSTLTSSILGNRGELGDGNLQMALIGWQPAFSAGGPNSLSSTDPIRRSGRILAEYMSPTYGMVRLEIGVERIF